MPCPVCRHQLKDAEIYPNNFLKRQILGLKVYCDRREVGCEWMGELREQEDHNDCCEFVTEKCQNLCGETAMRKDMEHHMQNVCRRRKIECLYCHMSLEYAAKTDHTNVCVMVPIMCDCGEPVIRKDMDYHTGNEGTCTTALLSCEFANAGCQVRANRKDLKEHRKNDVASHLSLVMATSERKLADVKLELVSTQKALAQSRSEVRYLQTVISSEFQRPVIASDGVTYVWKIANWQEQLRRINSLWSGTSINSPTFPLGFSGYTISIQHFPNGDGKFKGSHLSFHIYLHKGKVDDQLDFSARVRCAISIVDQALNGKDVTREWSTELSHVRATTCIGLVDDMISHQVVTTRLYLLNGSLLVKFQLKHV